MTAAVGSRLVRRAGVLIALLVIVPLAPRVAELIQQNLDLRQRRNTIRSLAEEPSAFDVGDAEILKMSLYESVEGAGAERPDGSLIVMVGSRACAFCDQAWSAWTRSIEITAPGIRPTVWYIGIDENATVPLLLANSPSVLVVGRRPKHSDFRLFSARTGVRVVPIAFVFSSATTLACVVSGVPSREQTEECMESPSTPKRGTTFVRNIDTRELVVLPGEAADQSPVASDVPVP